MIYSHVSAVLPTERETELDSVVLAQSCKNQLPNIQEFCEPDVKPLAI